MKTNIVKLCVVVTLALQTSTLAQRTEVRVRKGEVVAETASESVAVGAGRKAILSPDEGLSTTVDDPMVDDVMKIHQWVEEEKQAQREQIEATNILAIRIDSETRFTLAHFLEKPNTKSELRRVCWVEGVSGLGEPRFYDLQGRLLPFDVDKIGPGQGGNYAIRFPEPVAPGEKFRYLCVSKGDARLWQDGPLWHLQSAWPRAHCLNYFRFILPKSAIFVDSNRQVTVADTVEGNVAVTIRNYTGDWADGTCHIAFLWPDKDGTTLADLPPKYRGLRDEGEQELARAGQLGIAQIIAGEPFDDQSNPLGAVGTLVSAIARQDKERFLDLMVNPFIRGIAAQQYDQIIGGLGVQLAESFDFFSTPDWPEQPANGYEHPVYLSRKGSRLHDATIVTVYRDGKWYWGGLSNAGGSETENADDAEETPVDSVSVSRDKADLNAVTYEGLEPGRFIRKWLFLGPIDVPWEGEGEFPDEKTSNEFFEVKSLDLEQFSPQVRIGEQDYEWGVLSSEYGVIDLTKAFDKWFVVAYAWAQIDMPEETTGVLGIGADDAVQVWLNGELIHQNVIGRVLMYHDNVGVTFKKGKNQLVLKILNYGGPWGFSCRLLDQ